MHFHFDFSANEILWTLTFASLLVLLVVLIGRDRIRRYPWFSTSTAMMGLLLLTTQLLLPRMGRITGVTVYLIISAVDVLITLLVLMEMARRSFKGAGRVAWLIGTLVLLAVGGTVLALWGPWPAWKTLTAAGEYAALRLLQFGVDKGTMFTGVLTVELGLLATLFGRRFGAGWHSHTQRILIGLSTASMAQLALRGTLQAMGAHVQVHSQSDYERAMNLRDRLVHANNVVYLAVLIWWIVCLWFDEPGDAFTSSAETLSAAENEVDSPEESAATSKLGAKDANEPPAAPSAEK